jgi:hypothetical protein
MLKNRTLHSNVQTHDSLRKRKKEQVSKEGIKEESIKEARRKGKRERTREIYRKDR